MRDGVHRQRRIGRGGVRRLEQGFLNTVVLHRHDLEPYTAGPEADHLPDADLGRPTGCDAGAVDERAVPSTRVLHPPLSVAMDEGGVSARNDLGTLA